jgi:phosphate transport system protein
MPTTPEGFSVRISELKAELHAQSRRVQALLEAAFDSAFARDIPAADRAIALDDEVDRVDVELEKQCVNLLTEATKDGAALAPEQLRMVLTIVKVNNELERIADAGVAVAELVKPLAKENVSLPETFRVMTNSVVGILRDSSASLDRNNAQLAKVVLASEDAVEAFKRAILREAQGKVATGAISVDAAFLIQEVATRCEIMAGHCTNIAEQALYVATGAIVRHMGGHWEEVPV